MSLAPPASPNAETPSKARVLVVDDEAPVRAVAAMMFEHLGCETTEAPDGNRALALCAATAGGRTALPFDLVLLDLTLPGLSGLEVLERLRSTWPNLPVILASGRAPQELPTVDGPAVDFLLKPYTVAALEQATERALAQGPDR